METTKSASTAGWKQKDTHYQQFSIFFNTSWWNIVHETWPQASTPEIGIWWSLTRIPYYHHSQRPLYIGTHARLPFEAWSTPCIFQVMMDQILQGISNTICYLDDILIDNWQGQDRTPQNLGGQLQNHGSWTQSSFKYVISYSRMWNVFGTKLTVPESIPQLQD